MSNFALSQPLKALESRKYTSLGEAAIAFNVPFVVEEWAVRLDAKHTKGGSYSPLLLKNSWLSGFWG